jgi:hypothetical protein
MRIVLQSLLATTLLGTSIPVQAQAPIPIPVRPASSTVVAQSGRCIPLQVVEGYQDQTVVQKNVSPASALFVQSNWNTDFIVPPNRSFRSFVGKVQATDGLGRSFDLQMNLKYANGSVTQAYNATVPLKANQSQTMTGYPQTNMQPYQVNMVVGGVDALNTNYVLTVNACE